MRVLLVNREFPDTYWSFRHALPFDPGPLPVLMPDELDHFLRKVGEVNTYLEPLLSFLMMS